MARMSLLAALFLGMCLPSLARAERRASPPSAPHQPAQRAAERAIAYLQTESAAWLNQRHCAACHHVAMPLWALAEAGREGYATDQKFAASTAEATLGSLEKMQASGIATNPAAPPDPRPLAKGVNEGAVFMAVAAESLPALNDGQKQSLARIEAQILQKQRDDGSWDFYLSRPPINESKESDTAWMLMALQGDPSPNGADARRAAETKGLAWLTAQPGRPDDPQLKSLKLLLAIRAGTPRDTLQTEIDALLALQRSDGGWAQTAHGPTDAFATGQALYVLSLAGRTPSRPEIRRAIDFLVATQKPDGSWPMTSRATPDGRPGSAKLLTPITSAATAWSTLALTHLAPER
ncbi:MAG TPA: prenyltransferase/squalene oxidase repeat-containing protein [Tepidisphaeraceae bacterium]|jgi:hypothetical protein